MRAALQNSKCSNLGMNRQIILLINIEIKVDLLLFPVLSFTFPFGKCNICYTRFIFAQRANEITLQTICFSKLGNGRKLNALILQYCE